MALSRFAGSGACGQFVEDGPPDRLLERRSVALGLARDRADPSPRSFRTLSRTAGPISRLSDAQPLATRWVPPGGPGEGSALPALRSLGFLRPSRMRTVPKPRLPA